MIKKEEVIPMLQKSFPTVEKRWNDHLQWWGQKKRGLYNDVAVFAYQLIEDYEVNNTQHFPAVFQTVEKIINDGRQAALDLITIGFLEDVQTIALNHKFGYQVFEQWLQEKSKIAWYQLIKTWEGKSSLMEVVRSEKQQQRIKNIKTALIVKLVVLVLSVIVLALAIFRK